MNVGFPLLRTILESGRLPHLLLYGPSDVMRENLYTLLSEFYPIQPLVGYSSTFPVRYCGQYYEINMSLIQYKTHSDFVQVFHEILSKPIVFNTYAYRILVLTHCTHLKESIQAKLRVTMETHPHIRFIWISHRFQGIHEAIRSRCLCLRIPISPRSPMSPDPYQRISQRLSEIYTHDFKPLTKPIVSEIKELACALLKYHLSIPIFFQTLLQTLLANPRFIHSIKDRITRHLADAEHQWIRSYRTILHVEGCLVQLYYLTSTAHYEIHTDQEE